MSRQDAIGAAKRFVAVVGKKYPVDKAYVFGSFAKGRDDESSDIDVCIVSRFFGKNYLDEEMELRGLSVNVDARLSPVAFNPVDLEDKYNQLAFEIKKYGVQI